MARSLKGAKAFLKNHFVVSTLRFCDLHIQEVNKFEAKQIGNMGNTVVDTNLRLEEKTIR